jgi:choline dehydrogenase-like flavoprotein
MLERGRETLNDYADYNDQTKAAMITPHSSAAPGNGVVDWAPMRLFGIGGTALHFEGLMIRPQEEDLRVKSLYGYGRDWPITFTELEPWLLQAER